MSTAGIEIALRMSIDLAAAPASTCWIAGIVARLGDEEDLHVARLAGRHDLLVDVDLGQERRRGQRDVAGPAIVKLDVPPLTAVSMNGTCGDPRGRLVRDHPLDQGPEGVGIGADGVAGGVEGDGVDRVVGVVRDRQDLERDRGGVPDGLL